MVCLVEVVLKPGKRACPPLAASAVEPIARGVDAQPGYAGLRPWGFTPLAGTPTLQMNCRWQVMIYSISMEAYAVEQLRSYPSNQVFLTKLL
jgi:hypothetical protein